jgi:hypothetical protein
MQLIGMNTYENLCFISAKRMEISWFRICVRTLFANYIKNGGLVHYTPFCLVLISATIVVVALLSRRPIYFTL